LQDTKKSSTGVLGWKRPYGLLTHFVLWTLRCWRTSCCRCPAGC